MKIILCTLPNASDSINGVEFKRTENGMLAEVEDDVAAHFLGIDGYEELSTGEGGAGPLKEPVAPKTQKAPASGGSGQKS